MNTPAMPLLDTLPLKFGGKTYDPQYDERRLAGQLLRVYEVLKSGRWMTLQEIQDIAGGSEAGISARIRDLRKPQFGSHTIDKRRRGEPTRGWWEYKLDD